jgi:hypothetical protein
MSEDFDENGDMIMKIIKDLVYKDGKMVKPIDKSKEIVAVLTHADTDDKKDLLKRCLTEIKKQGFKTMVSSHIHDVTEDMHDLIDYLIYDKDNPVIMKDEFSKYNSFLQYTYSHPAFALRYIMKYNHGYAAITLMKNASKLAELYKYEKIHFVNYDYILTDPKVLIEHSTALGDNDVVSYMWGGKKESISTGFFSTKPQLFNIVMSDVNSKDSYCKIGKHICEETVYELYSKYKKKILHFNHEELEKRIVANKVGVKVLPIHDIKENSEESGHTLVCLCVNQRGKKYLVINYNTAKENATVRLSNTKIDYTFETGMIGPGKFMVSDLLLEEGITVEINGKIYETIDKNTDTGDIDVRLENEFINLEQHVR